MCYAVINREVSVSVLGSSNADLLTVGAAYARDVHALCNDVAAMTFPTAISSPTDELISAVKAKLVAVVFDVEDRLHKGAARTVTGLPATWPLLAQSGFLREPDLIDFMLARVAEDRLSSKIESTPPFVAKLLDHADIGVAEAAQALLAAESLHRHVRGMSYKALRPELLHQLCWRVVAAFEVAGGARDANILENARSLLAEYDESQTVQPASRKLAHFLGAEGVTDLLDPEKSGLHLYAALLASNLDIDHDQVLCLMDSSSIAPLSVMLCAVGNSFDQALATIYMLKGFSLTPNDVAMFNSGFPSLKQELAAEEIRRWAVNRAQFLMSQQAKSIYA